MTEKVRLFDNERLDIPDASALSDLVYEYVGRVCGALMGSASGALTHPSMDYSDIGNLKFGPMYLYDHTFNNVTYPFGEDLDGDPAEIPEFQDNSVTTGKILLYDSNRSVQNVQLVDAKKGLGSTLATCQTVYLWARRTEVESDIENRVRWEDTSEVLVSDQATRFREVIELKSGLGVNANPFPQAGPQESDGFRWGKIEWYENAAKNNAITPYLVVYSPFDIARGSETANHNENPINWNTAPNPTGTLDSSKASFARYVNELTQGTEADKFQTGKSAGLATLSRLVIDAIYRIKGTHDDWAADVVRSLKECDGALRVVENTASNFLQSERVTVRAPTTNGQLFTNTGTFVEYKAQKQHYLHCAAYVRYNPATNTNHTGERDAYQDLKLTYINSGQIGPLQGHLSPFRFPQVDAFGDGSDAGLVPSLMGKQPLFTTEGPAKTRILVKRYEEGSFAIIVKAPPTLPNENDPITDVYGQLFEIQSVQVTPAFEYNGNKFDSLSGVGAQSTTGPRWLHSVVHRGTLNQLHAEGDPATSQPWFQCWTNTITGDGFEFTQDDKLITVHFHKVENNEVVPGIFIHDYISKPEGANGRFGTNTVYFPRFTPAFVPSDSPRIPLVNDFSDKGTHRVAFLSNDGTSPETAGVKTIVNNVNTGVVDGSTFEFTGPYPRGGFYRPVYLAQAGSTGVAIDLTDNNIIGPSQHIAMQFKAAQLYDPQPADCNFYLTIHASKVAQIGQDFSTSTTTAGPTYTGSEAYQEK